VRELENVIGHAAMMTEATVIDVNDIVDLLRDEAARQPDSVLGETFVCSSRLPMEEVERRYIEQVVREENDNVTQASARLGIPRSTLYQRIKESHHKG